MESALSIANLMIYIADIRQMESFTHLKLQKLLYYAQGTYLAKHGVPLFEDKMYKWPYGPVVESVYRMFKVAGNKPLISDGAYPTINDTKVVNHVANILESFGQYGAIQLSEMTHRESPWLTTEDNQEITLEKLKDYFFPIAIL